MNPIQILSKFKGQSPQQIAMQLIGNTNNPVINNLVQMAKNGDRQGVENFARNVLKEQGRDFDEEYNNLINQFGLKK